MYKQNNSFMSHSFYIVTINTVFECHPCRINKSKIKLQHSSGTLGFLSFNIQVELVEIFPLKYSKRKQVICNFRMYCLLKRKLSLTYFVPPSRETLKFHVFLIDCQIYCLRARTFRFLRSCNCLSCLSVSFQIVHLPF